MVCMKSSTGVATRRSRGESPTQIPSGRPITSEISTAAISRARVSMLSRHSPSRPSVVKPATASRATRQLPTA